MQRDTWLFILGVIGSGFLSWLTTHLYYKKSLRQQQSAAESQIAVLTDILEAGNQKNVALLKQKRIEESVAEYRRAGTPVRVIDTYSDLTNEEKAEILDTVLLRVKGRRAKNNKYREY